MRTSVLKKVEVILGLLALGLAVCSTAPGCVHQVPTGYRVDDNEIISGQPQYWLDVGRATFGYKAQHLYTFDIISSEQPFSRALLSLREEDPSTGCGIGEFSFDTEHYFRDPVCRNLIITTERPFTQMAPLIWKSPSCGCVIVNATVLTKRKEYYTDVTVDGRLSTRLCLRTHAAGEENTVKERGVTKRNTETELSYADRVELLCKISRRFTEADILNRELVLKRRGISKTILSQLLKVEHALETRRGDIRECCETQSHEGRRRCFSDMRRRRIDRYCGDGEPDVPFTMQRAKFMKDREAECCWKRGESRYGCFAASAKLKIKESFEYSLDETDPVNDIADYPTEIEEIEKDLNSKFFKTEEVVSQKLEATHTPVTTSSTSTATPTTTPEATTQTTSSPEETEAPFIRKPRDDPVKKVIQELTLKLSCCREGKMNGDSMNKDASIYVFCRNRWRGYRKTLNKGKNMCHQKFMECCVKEAEVSTIQAVSSTDAGYVTPDTTKMTTEVSTHETQQHTPKATPRRRPQRLSKEPEISGHDKEGDTVDRNAFKNRRSETTTSGVVLRPRKHRRHNTTPSVTAKTTTKRSMKNEVSSKTQEDVVTQEVTEPTNKSNTKESTSVGVGAEKTSRPDKNQKLRLRDLDTQWVTKFMKKEIRKHLRKNPSDAERVLHGDGPRRRTQREKKHGQSKSKSKRDSKKRHRRRHRHHKHRQIKSDKP